MTRADRIDRILGALERMKEPLMKKAGDERVMALVMAGHEGRMQAFTLILATLETEELGLVETELGLTPPGTGPARKVKKS